MRCFVVIRILSVVACFIFMPYYMNAQVWEWAVKIDGLGEEEIKAFEKGDDGTFYIAGTFDKQLTGGDTTIYSLGEEDVFLAKIDTLGNIIWLQHRGSNLEDKITDLAIDDEGNVYITGGFPAYVAKYSQYGDLIWQKINNVSCTYLPYQCDNRYNAIAQDQESIYLTETYYTYNNHRNYITKRTKDSGDIIWRIFCKQKEGISDYIDIEVFSERIYTAGNNNYYQYHFQRKYSLSGEYLDEITYQFTEDTPWNAKGAIDISQDGKILSVGSYYKNSFRDNEIFYIFQHDTSYNKKWHKRVASPEMARSTNVTHDQAGNGYVCGTFKNQVSFEIEKLLGNEQELFVAKYNPDGTNLWAKKAGNGGGDIAYDIIAGKNNVYVVGKIIIDSYFDDIYLECEGYSSGFIAKLSLFPPAPGSIDGPINPCVGDITFSVEEKPFVQYEWATGDNNFSYQANGHKMTAHFAHTDDYQVKVRTVNDHGSSEWETLEVIVKAKPGASWIENYQIQGNDIVCQQLEVYAAPVIKEAGYTWSLNNGGTLFPVNNTALVDWQTPGVHTLSVLPGNECGLGDTIEFEVTVQEEAGPPGEIKGPTEICTGSATYSLMDNPEGSFNWSLSGGGEITAAGNQATIQWVTAGVHTITVSPAGNCGTGGSSTLNVTVKDNPAKPSYIEGSKKPCKGAVEDYSITGISGVSYTWEISGGGFISRQDGGSATVKWSVPGQYSLSVTPANSCGEGPARDVQVTVQSSPARPDSIFGMDTTCLGAQTYHVPHEKDISYTWSLAGDGTLDPADNKVTVTWNTAGDHQLSVTPVNQCGAGSSKSLSINVSGNNNQIRFAETSDSSCLVETDYAVRELAGLSFQWKLDSGGNILPKNDTSITVNWTRTGTRSLVVRSLEDGCQKSLPVTVIDIPAPVDSIFGETQTCQGNATYFVEQEDGLDYQWSVDDGGNLSAHGEYAEMEWNGPGNYLLQVKAGNACGFSSGKGLQVEVVAQPVIPTVLYKDSVLCKGTKGVYTVQARENESYDWNLNKAGGILNEKNDSASVDWIGPGHYSLEVESSNICGTSDPVNFAVRVETHPSIQEVYGDQDVCMEEIKYWLQPDTGVTYHWALATGGVLSAFPDSAFVDWNTKGDHRLSVIPENTCGAGDTFQVLVQVKDIPVTMPILSGDTIICKGQVGLYQAEEKENVLHSWSLPSGGDLDATGNQAEITWQEAGQHVLSLIPSNECGSATPSSIQVDVKDVPLAPMAIQGKDSVCTREGALYNVKNAVEAYQYTWGIGHNGTLANLGDSAIVSWQDTGLYTLSVFATNTCGDGDTTTRSILVKTLPFKKEIQGVQDICKNDWQVFHVDAEKHVTYSWSLADTLYVSGEDSIKLSWDDTGEHGLVLVPENYCGAGPVDTFTVKIEEIPGAVEALEGDLAPCLGEGAYLPDPETGNVKYTWITPGLGDTIPSDKSSVLMNWKQTGTDSLGIFASNYCGTSDTSYFTVRVMDIPESRNWLTGMEHACLRDTLSYALAFDDSLVYNWYMDGKWLGQENQYRVRRESPGKNIILAKPVNKCGEGDSLTFITLVEKPPGKPSEILGKDKVCHDQTSQLRVPNIPDGCFCYWNIPSGYSLTDTIWTLRGLNEIAWERSGQFLISVSLMNNCGESEPVQKSVRVDTICPKPAIMFNEDTLYCNEIAVNYIWLFENMIVQSGELGYFVPSEAGEYQLQLENECGLGELSDPVYIGDEEEESLGISIFPNPTTGKVNIAKPVNLQVQQLDIYDIKGKWVYSFDSTKEYKDPFYFDKTHKGVYILHFHTNMGQVRERVVVY